MKHLITLALLFSLALTSHASSKVYLLKTSDRVNGIKKIMRNVDLSELAGKKVIIKPNYNSDDPYPATTHLDTLKTVIRLVKRASPESVTILERSGMGETGTVLRNRGVVALTDAEDVRLIDLDKLAQDDWVIKGKKGTHWKQGYPIPRELLAADYVINLACLKTHRFGGDFTLSLKNNVGLVAKWHGFYNYMSELHSSPHLRAMVAEINREIPNHLVLIDGLQGFGTEGPDRGRLIKPGILILSTDRVAADAVGVAILRHYGTTKRVGQGTIFEQDQLKRAVELKLGALGPSDIELVPLDAQAKKLAGKIRRELDR